MVNPRRSGKGVVATLSSAFLCAVATVFILIAIVLGLAVSRGSTYQLPILVKASGGTGADLGSMTVNAGGLLLWVLALAVVYGLMGIGFGSRRK